MDYIKNIEKDEILDGFLVTTDRKKAWNKMMEILVEIDRICRKYSIKYFADAGTLIGAARHKGFIPWDDDIDIMMLRPDYEKFKQVAQGELTGNIKLINAYTSDVLFSISKIMDVETAAIEEMEVQYPQGIFVDIWPYDDFPDGSKRCSEIWEIRQSLLGATMNPQGLMEAINNGVQCKPSNEFILEFLKLPPVERFREYEKFCANHFGESEKVGYPLNKLMGGKGNLKREYYREVVYLDFEGFKMPVPVDYETVLTAEFGDWHKFVRTKALHETEYLSADLSYKEIQDRINHKLKDVESD